MRISARFLLLFLFLLPFFFFISKKTFAQTPQPQAAILNTNPDVQNTVHNTTQVVMIETLSALACQLTGRDFVNPNQNCLGVDPVTKKIGFVNQGGGLISTMSTLIGYTYVPPTSSLHYMNYLSNNFGISKSAYAADCSPNSGNYSGIGFCGLQPVLGIWIFMRNIVYLFFVIIFVMIGLGIMLRIHIDPRTVMSIQNQIPKIIIGLVLVTFSFSIAGFMVDMMYVTSYLVGNIISNAAPHGQTVSEVATANNPFDAVNRAYTGGAFQLVGDSSANITELINSIFFGPSGDNAFVDRFGEVDVIGGILRSLVGIFVGILAFIIIAIAVIYVLIRLWIILLFSYINILLDIIFAPFWFLAGLLPGSTLGISAWFRDLIANLSVFPATVAMLILTNVFIRSFSDAAKSGGDFFVPPLLGNPTNIASVTGIIGLGFFFMLPNVLTFLKAALKSPKINLGPLFGPVGSAAGLLVGTARTYARIETGARETHTVPPPEGAPAGTLPQYQRTGRGRAIGRLLGR